MRALILAASVTLFAGAAAADCTNVSVSDYKQKCDWLSCSPGVGNHTAYATVTNKSGKGVEVFFWVWRGAEKKKSKTKGFWFQPYERRKVEVAYGGYIDYFDLANCK